MVTVRCWCDWKPSPARKRMSKRFSAVASLVEAEPATTAWFGIRLESVDLWHLDAFPDEAGRSAHLSGRVAAALGEKASNCSPRPTIERVDVVAAKLPR